MLLYGMENLKGKVKVLVHPYTGIGEIVEKVGPAKYRIKVMNIQIVLNTGEFEVIHAVDKESCICADIGDFGRAGKNARKVRNKKGKCKSHKS